MKYLVLLGVIVGFIWWIKLNRAPASSDPRSSASPPQHMVACLHCGVHLPQDDALQTRNGFYCSPEHRARQES